LLAAAAASKYKDELTDARHDARQAIAEARDAKKRIEQARQQIADAGRRLADARQAMTTAANDMTASASSGMPPVAAQAAHDQASGAADTAEAEISQAKRALERAEEDLERAQQRGRRAEERAKDSATMLRGALMAASPGVMGLAVGAPATAPAASGANFQGLSPEQVATFFRRVGPEGGTRLAETHPELVGPLDGAPLALRYVANRALAGREVQRLEGELAGVEAELQDEDGGFGFPPLVSPLPIIAGREIVDRLTTSRKEELEAERAELEGKIGDARAFSDPDRQLLMYDPRGDGRVAEVFGDLGRADHATVMVPGIGNSMDGFDGEVRREAQVFHAESSRLTGDRAATVAWLGYDSPDGFTDPETLRNDAAAEGGESLARSLDGINANNPSAHTTVIGHSYGSVVTGQAAGHHGLNVDDVVLTGSPGPGTGIDHASDLSRGGEARVWVAQAPGDPVADPTLIPDPPQMPGLKDDVVRELILPEVEDRASDIHGPDPAAPQFGAQRFETGPPPDPAVTVDHADIPYIRPGDIGIGSVDIPIVSPVLGGPQLGHIPIPIPEFGAPEVDHVSVPYPSDVNWNYPVDQHGTYYDRRTEGFANLTNIAAGNPGAVTRAP